MRVHGISGLRHYRTWLLFSLIFTVLSILACDSGFAAPPTPETTSPASDVVISNRRPDFVWTPSGTATWYRVHISRNRRTYSSKWVEATNSTWTVDIDLRGGAYKWWVQSWTAAEKLSSWSAPATFTVPIMTPAKTTLLSPSGDVGQDRPTFRWAAAENATWYRLWMSKDGKSFLAKWINGTNYTPVTDLPLGDYSWWIRTWGLDGLGPWSDSLSLNHGLPTALAPTGSRTNGPTDFVWTSTPNTDWYQLLIYRNGKRYIRQLVNGPTNVTLSASLPSGEYRWWVRGWRPDGFGPWSQTADLLVALPGTYEYRVVANRLIYGKNDAWQSWMFKNKSRFKSTYDKSKDLPDTITIGFWYETDPIAYNPAWASESEHMDVLEAMAEGAYHGYDFNFAYRGNPYFSYARVTAGTAGTTSYAWGHNMYLYYETIFNHEFGHVMNLPHHYDTVAEVGDGKHTPPGDSLCIMDRTSSLFCSACRTALDVPLDVTDSTAVDDAMDEILARYP